MDDLPPWDDINPPATVSGQTSSPLAGSLAPAPREDFARELTKCLSLVAPVGMDVSARSEWLAAAWETVGHLPRDLLQIGAAHAREVADHPSRIVPAIIAETGELLAQRRKNAQPERRDAPQIEKRLCEPAAAEQILREYGLLDAVRRA